MLAAAAGLPLELFGALEGGALVAIGLRNQVRRHERRRAQRAIENERGVGCEWNSAFATTVHRAASVIKPRSSGTMVPAFRFRSPATIPFFAGSRQRSSGQYVYGIKNSGKRMPDVHVPKRFRPDARRLIPA